MGRWSGVRSGEKVVRRLHAHAKMVLFSLLISVLLLAFVALAFVLIPPALGMVPAVIAGAPAAIGAVGVALFALWRYYAEVYTITENRLLTRVGFIRPHITSIDLDHVSSLGCDADFVDQLFGYGTLFIETREDTLLVLRDISHVHRVHAELSALVVARDECDMLSGATA